MIPYPPPISGRSPAEVELARVEGADAPAGRPAAGAQTVPAQRVARPSVGSDMPPAPADGHMAATGTAAATFAGVPVRAVEDVMAERVRQIDKFGHTLARDREQGLMPMVKQVARLLSGAIDYVHFHKLDLARRYMVRTAAMSLACIDWIDAEIEAQARRDPL